ncbi:MAG: hypothetical protein U1E73_08665 [Planctomycetota bacterium]
MVPARSEAPLAIDSDSKDALASGAATGIEAPEEIQERLSCLRRYRIPLPDGARLPSLDRWDGVAARVETLDQEIQKAAADRQRIGDQVAARRMAEGRFETIDITVEHPSTKDPDYRSKWPWMDPKPGEWQHTVSRSADGRAILEVVRVYPGEEPELDLATRKRDDLIAMLRKELETEFVQRPR